MTLEDSYGTPTLILADTADLQRFIADRHGTQRARLGWTREALARESVLLKEEVDRAIARCFTDPASKPQVDEALAVVHRYLEQGAETGRRALERARENEGGRRSG